MDLDRFSADPRAFELPDREVMWVRGVMGGGSGWKPLLLLVALGVVRVRKGCEGLAMPCTLFIALKSFRFLKSLVLLFVCLAVTPALSEPEQGPHIVYVLAEREYGTLESVPRFHEETLKPLGYRATFIIASDEDDVRNDLSGLAKALETADLCFLSVRRRAPAEKDMQAFIDFVAAGKPVVAIRTSSHAFHLRGAAVPEGHKLWEEFDEKILGGNYRGHYREEPAEISVVEGAEDHPILAGVGPLLATSKLYQTGPLRETATALLLGEIDGKDPEPVAWTHLAGENGARIFYTSLGWPGEFEDAEFRKLLVNAIGWALAGER